MDSPYNPLLNDNFDYGSTSNSHKRNVGSVIYCVHGKIASDCCDLKNLEIKEYHCHAQTQRNGGIDKVARKKLIIASILCVVFMVVEIIGGVLSNSLAIATDAAHLLADLASFMISLLAIYITKRRSTKRMSFGFHRAEVIGALVSVLLIWIVTAILVYISILRTIYGQFELDSQVMLITSFFGIIVNIIMGCTLHGHGHSHSNETTLPSDNINVRAALIHVISDFVQSCGVFIGALIIYFVPEFTIIDPICTFIFSILVLLTTINIMKDALLVLMEGIPEYLDYSEILETFLQINGVVRVHNLRIWALSINKVALAAHLAVDESINTEQVLQEATKRIHAKYDFFETTLQIEIYKEDMEACRECANPE